MNLIRYLVNSFSGDNDVSSEDVYNKTLTIPNIITTLGILFTVLYIMQFVYGLLIWFIPFNIILIGISDLLDGYAATRLNQHSWIGKFIDGLRDRFAGCAILLHIATLFPVSMIYVLIGILIFFEIANALIVVYIDYRTMKSQSVFGVHVINKIRQSIHLLCGFIFVLQQCSINSFVIQIDWLLLSMIFASAITAMRSFCTMIILFWSKESWAK